EQVGEGEGVGDSGRGRKQISAGKQQQAAGAQHGELREQQDRGDQVVDGKRRLIARDERRHGGKRHPRKGRGAGEQGGGYGYDDQRNPAVAARGGAGGKKEVAVASLLPFHLLQNRIWRSHLVPPEAHPGGGPRRGYPAR